MLTKVHSLFRFPQFSLISFSCSRILIRITHGIQLSSLFSLLVAVTASQALLGFDNFDSFEEYWSGISQAVLQLRFVWSFSCDEIRVICLGEKNQRGKVPFSSYHKKSRYYQHDSLLLTLTVITWLHPFTSTILYCTTQFNII